MDLAVSNGHTRRRSARLSRQLTVVARAAAVGRPFITSRTLALEAADHPSQVRRDLTALGAVGRRGLGYDVGDLLERLRDRLQPAGQGVALVGAGALGRALACSRLLQRMDVRIALAFDADPRLVGTRLGSATVLPAARIAEAVAREEIAAGVIATRPEQAQEACDGLTAGGVRLVVSYVEGLLRVPSGTTVHVAAPAAALALAAARGDVTRTLAGRAHISPLAHLAP